MPVSSSLKLNHEALSIEISIWTSRSSPGIPSVTEPGKGGVESTSTPFDWKNATFPALSTNFRHAKYVWPEVRFNPNKM